MYGAQPPYGAAPPPGQATFYGQAAGQHAYAPTHAHTQPPVAHAPPQQPPASTATGVFAVFSAPFFQPNAVQFLPDWFRAVDKDGSGRICGPELQRLLCQQGLNFSLKFCNGLIRLMDQTASGNLTYEEFAQTHALLVSLLKQFQGADTNRDGQISVPEVSGLIKAAGFTLDEHSFMELCKAYDLEKTGYFDLHEYIGLYVFVSNCKSIFTAFDPYKAGSVTLDFSKFVYAASICS
uniref:EF-hand domain-containing protein n=1 Tax=Pyramimonas obovata TaxID=1411642 RepID=A0A7S0N0W1_9CHLO|eukprot:CAMPEP_0118927834 /NCGR_PEP_ID=MMETSP1169-20130426/5221_1 /TAXON_ID=36882 /ORGANISM="Pyramimonas obovata, Strain CCMP722" /LENGTH=235 /DNA_ID=CAMNT_0006869681 /DNA_START=59 /DNA_END=766 /DNA_ORIENTATION=-